MVEISIVVVNYNGKDLLKLCLDSINQISLSKDLFEIIVVDNNSADGSVDFIRRNYKNVKVISNPRNMGYVGINSALPLCRGKYLLFLNNDIEIDRNCAKELLNVMQKDERIAMAAPRLVNYYNKSLKSGGTWVSRSFYNGHTDENTAIKEIPYLGVGLIRKDFVNKFHYIFDPDYFIYAEDLDLGLRIRLLGFKLVFVPKAILYHLHAVTSKKMGSSQTTFLLERNLLTTFFKILSAGNILLFLPYVFLMRIFAIARDISTIRLSSAFARIKAIFWIIFNFGTIAKKRKYLQILRKADDKFILEVFSEKYLLKKSFIV